MTLSMPGPFDEVQLLGPHGERQRLRAEEFFQLPLSDRIAHVIRRTATFWSGGREVDRQIALAALRKQRAGM